MKLGWYTGKLIDPKVSFEVDRKAQMAEFRFYLLDVYLAWGNAKRIISYKGAEQK